jgi:hypothetical protein
MVYSTHVNILKDLNMATKLNEVNHSRFGSVVVIVFQSVFHLKMHQNDVFLFFKNHFWYQRIKIIWKH